MCGRQQVENVEDGGGGFKTAIARESAFSVSKRCLPVRILFVNDEPMGACREFEYGRGLLRHSKDEIFGGFGGERGEYAGWLRFRRGEDCVGSAATGAPPGCFLDEIEVNGV